MDRSQLAAIALTLLVLAAIAWRLHGPESENASSVAVVATTAPTVVRKGNASPTPTAFVVAQRLAGVALGSTRYAVVEQPDGSTALYRIGDDVPGLGRIVEVTENSATFEGSDARIRLNVKPPPSPTRVPATSTAAPDQGTSTPEPSTRSPSPGRSATVSPPSSAPGPPAS